MLKWIMVVALAVTPITAVSQQQEPSADSLVAYWLRRGALGNWSPGQLFHGCPNLANWQQRGIQLLLNAELSREREDQLAISWGNALSECADPRVENWLFVRVNRAMERGEHPWMLLSYWDALKDADSPGVRAYLRDLMLDTSKPETYRDHAAGALFSRFGPDERMREYLAAFETRRMPFETQVGQTTILLQREPERLLREVGRRVRENPDLAEQAAFTLIVESANRYATPGSRRALAAELQEGIRCHPKTGRQLERANAAIVHLQRDPVN